MATYLSYLMGADKIQDKELEDLNIEIFGRTESKSRKLKISRENLSEYIELVRNKLSEGFWNEILGDENILFIFKFKDGSIKKFTLSTENEPEIAKLCTEFNGEPPGKTANVYKYISENDFYQDFMLEHYDSLINRKMLL